MSTTVTDLTTDFQTGAGFAAESLQMAIVLLTVGSIWIWAGWMIYQAWKSHYLEAPQQNTHAFIMATGKALFTSTLLTVFIIVFMSFT
jgi:hypothetical protein